MCPPARFKGQDPTPSSYKILHVTRDRPTIRTQRDVETLFKKTVLILLMQWHDDAALSYTFWGLCDLMCMLVVWP